MSPAPRFETSRRVGFSQGEHRSILAQLVIIGLAALATIWIYRWQIRLGEQYRPEEVGPRADVMTIVGVILPAALIGWLVCP